VVEFDAMLSMIGAIDLQALHGICSQSKAATQASEPIPRFRPPRS